MNEPTLDGKTEDWSGVQVFEEPLTGALTSKPYDFGSGTVKIRCGYDAERIYFLFEVPGKYRFAKDNNHMCASISTMFQMGDDAELYNMGESSSCKINLVLHSLPLLTSQQTIPGNCPLASNCNDDSSAIPGGCNSYKVDLGGHWELSTTGKLVTHYFLGSSLYLHLSFLLFAATEMGVAYDTNEGNGDDAVANKDDEYAVNPLCRFDDDDAKAANEWKGAWLHSNPIAIERANTNGEGTYIFEMSRALQTDSVETDAQLEVGGTVGFGFAFWDPFETEADGWSDSGHYVTGCSSDWIDLKLVDDGTVGTSAALTSGSKIICGFAALAMTLTLAFMKV
jgi:hypothetical protein